MIRNLERNIYVYKSFYPYIIGHLLFALKDAGFETQFAAKWLYSLSGRVNDKPLLLLESLTG